jgi:hypothetical protein
MPLVIKLLFANMIKSVNRLWPATCVLQQEYQKNRKLKYVQAYSIVKETRN